MKVTMTGKTATAVALTICAAISLAGAEPADQNPSSPSPPSGQPPAAAKAPEAPKKKEIGTWWHKSSMAYEPLIEKWQFHLDATLSFMNAAGNTSGSTLDSSISADLRKDRLTSHSFFQVSRKDINYVTTHSLVTYTERTTREQVDFDITAHLQLLAGIEDYQNTLMFMDKRLNVYGGVGATVFRNEKHQLNLTAAIGHANFIFDHAQLLSVDPTATNLDTTPASFGALGYQSWRWTVSPRFTFNEDASYMDYLLDDLGHRLTLNLNGTFPISKHFSFNLSYRLKNETNTIIKALKVLPEDRTFLVGIKVSI